MFAPKFFLSRKTWEKKIFGGKQANLELSPGYKSKPRITRHGCSWEKGRGILPRNLQTKVRLTQWGRTEQKFGAMLESNKN